MQTKDLLQLFEIFKKDELAIVYNGDFSNYILGLVTELVKDYLLEDKSLVRLRNKLSFLIIEAFQNTMRYGDHQYKDQASLTHELFILRNIEKIFYIITANLIENERIGYVYNKLEEVNKLTEDELKELYVKILTNKQLTERGGAGLGFIEMVRKTKEKLDFDFVPISKEASFFYFQMKMKAKGTKPPEKYLSIEETKQLHKIISEQNIIIIHKGDYDEKSIIPLLNMTEKNFQTKELGYQKKTFIILVETLQNISKHAYQNNGRREGISVISYKDGHYYINSGNYIENHKVPIFRAILEKMKNTPKEELNSQYLQMLRSDKIRSGGLGLVEIARDTEYFDFNFQKCNDFLSFFSLSIKV